MPTLDDFPHWSPLLRPTFLSPPFLLPMAHHGPRTFNGRSQVIGPDAGYWIMKLGIDFLDPEELLEWRGIVTDMQGGLNPYVFPIFDDGQAPNLDGGAVGSKGAPHSDGTYFTDGTGYVQSTIEVRLRTDVEEGDTEASFDIVSAGEIRRGTFFSFDGRLYQINRPPNYLPGFRVDVEMLPPARADVAAGAEPEFARPKVLMDLALPSTGRIDELRDFWNGSAEIELHESFDGLS